MKTAGNAGLERPRRVLIVSYYFPPAGGPGVQRVLKFVQYLREFGWEPTVLTVRDGAYPAYDRSLAEEVPRGIHVERTEALDPYNVYARLSGKRRGELLTQGSLKSEEPAFKARVVRWLRANILLPDARVGWVPHAARSGSALLREKHFHAVLTSGPPHSTHLVGRYLAARHGISWVADFRDPWTDINYYHELPHSALARAVDRFIERHVLASATAVTTVSPSWRDLLYSKVPDADTVFRVVQNGFDPPDIPVDEPPDDRFVCSHVGSLYASRNPTALWAALGKLHKQGEIPDLTIQLIGPVDDAVRRSVSDAGLDALVSYHGYVQHREATRMMCRSHVLLLSIEPFAQDAGMITGKMYEYLASSRPILGLGPSEGDAAALIRRLKAGNMFERDDEAGMRKALLDTYTTWAIGNKLKGASSAGLAPYTRRAQTEVLSRILYDVSRRTTN